MTSMTSTTSHFATDWESVYDTSVNKSKKLITYRVIENHQDEKGVQMKS